MIHSKVPACYNSITIRKQDDLLAIISHLKFDVKQCIKLIENKIQYLEKTQKRAKTKINLLRRVIGREIKSNSKSTKIDSLNSLLNEIDVLGSHHEVGNLKDFNLIKQKLTHIIKSGIVKALKPYQEERTFVESIKLYANTIIRKHFNIILLSDQIEAFNFYYEKSQHNKSDNLPN